MDDIDDHDTYVSQLREVFNSCDTTGSHCLNELELTSLCQKLHLVDHTSFLVHNLLDKKKAQEVKFEDFKNCFISLLSQSLSNDLESEINEKLFTNENQTREVSPKFTFGEKKYGRRSRPASLLEEDNENLGHEFLSSPKHPSRNGTRSIKADGISIKRPMSPSYPQQPPMKSGRMVSPSNDGGSFEEASRFCSVKETNHRESQNHPCELSTVEYLQQTWRNLGIGKDGYLIEDELSLVCKHIGMDMTDEVVAQLFVKLDYDQDGRIGFDEFLQGLFQHITPQAFNATEMNAVVASSLFKESPRSEDISTSFVSGIFSCIDPQNTGYADSSSILELWDSLEMSCSSQIFQDLAISSKQKICLNELSLILEDEMINSFTTPLGQLAFVSYQNELNYLRLYNQQIQIEKNKLKENIEEANSRGALLAQEVDDHHAKLEKALQEKLLVAEKKYHEQVRELVEEFQQERDAAAVQSNKLNFQLKKEIQCLKEEEVTIKCRLEELELENSRLELELQDVNNRYFEFQKQNEIYQKEIFLMSDLKQKLAEFESKQVEAEQQQSLVLDIENYKQINQELQDKIDELTLEIENMPQQISSTVLTSNVNRSHSWLSDYRKSTSGFKRRGSGSDSEDNSDDETSGKVRRTTSTPDDLNGYFHTAGTSKLVAVCLEGNQHKSSQDAHPRSIDALLKDMLVDRETLITKFHSAEGTRQKLELSNSQLHMKCKILTRLAFEASKTVLR